LLAALDAAHSAQEQVRLVANFNRRLFERGLDVLETLRGAGSAEPDLAAAWREAELRRRTGQTPIVHAWAERGLLRLGLSERHAADILWTFTGPDVFRLLVVDSQWPPDEYEQHLTELLEHTLLGSSDSGR